MSNENTNNTTTLLSGNNLNSLANTTSNNVNANSSNNNNSRPGYPSSGYRSNYDYLILTLKKVPAGSRDILNKSEIFLGY